MKKLSPLILFCISVSAFGQESIDLECYANGKNQGSYRLFPDKNDEVKEGLHYRIYTTWTLDKVTIYREIDLINRPFSTIVIKRETLEYSYENHLVAGSPTVTGVCKLIEKKNQI